MQCLVYDSGDAVASDHTFVCVYSVPPFVDGASETTDATVILNNILELECYATGTPTPTIT